MTGTLDFVYAMNLATAVAIISALRFIEMFRIIFDKMSQPPDSGPESSALIIANKANTRQYNKRGASSAERSLAVKLCVSGLIFLVAAIAMLSPFQACATETIAPVVRSAAEIDYPPFSIVHEDGRADGFSVELMRETLGKMGRKATFRTGPWAEVRGWLEKGEIDALPLVGRTPEREHLFDFTFPYMTMYGAIVVRKEANARSLADLRGQQVCVMKGDNAEEFLRREKRDFIISTTPSFTDAFHALSKGSCDAVVVQRLVALRLLEETGIRNLKIVDAPVYGFSQDFCFAVKKGDSKLLSVLNEGLALAVADGTHRRLHAKWFAHLELPSDRTIVIGGDHNYPPFEFLDEKGRPAGFTVELTRAVAREMNIDARIQLGPWADMVDALRDGKIDALEGMFYSPERDRVLDFSPRYLVIHCVGVVRKGEGPPPSKIEELRGRDLVVQAGDAILDALAEHGIEARVTTVETQEDVARAVAEGRNDIGLMTRFGALHAVRKYGWKNIEIGRQAFYSGEYAYAVPQGNEALLAQFTEGLRILKDSGEYQRIYEKWLGVYEPSISSREAIRRVALVAAPLLMIVILALLWSWSLRRQIAVRTRELRESLERFRAVFEAANVGKSITLPTGEININKAFADMLGYSVDDLKGKSWQELTPPEDVPETERRIAPLLDGKEDHTRFDKRYVRKDGSAVWTDVSSTIRRDSNNNPLHFITTVVDITERKRAEKFLRESEERYRSTLDGMLEGCQIITPEWKYAYVNEAAARHGRKRTDELIGHTMMEAYPGIEDTELFSALRECMMERVPRRFENEFKYADGGRGYFQLSVEPVPEGLFILSQDITKQRIMEAQLIQSQKMESVGRLAGGVAHDFNNMLSVIIGNAEIAMASMDAADPIYKDIEEIHKAGERSAELTRQLLAFARKQTVSPVAMDLNKSVSNMLKMLQRLIGEDIDLVWKPGHNIWTIKIDPSQIDRIIANLIVNARESIAGVGKVTIETENTALDEEYCADHIGFIPGEYAMIAVSDDGCGMDTETLNNIFEPFYTTKGKGTGLGLATVYGAVRQNNGFINVYSEPGKGSTFKVYLPRFESENGEETAKTGPPRLRPTGTETVLIVEDEPAILSLGKRILEGLGYKTLAAKTPSEAFQKAEEYAGDIHLLLTDVVMPEMTGREVAEKLGATRPNMKFLYMSGYTANVIAHHGILDAGVRFVQKPFSVDELAQKIREALDG
ncbi:MAG TPA: transporter substrate-binding domain-containing protein [bacterium]|nr:transporter substrate-binding domain-containing protein [bacterium]